MHLFIHGASERARERKQAELVHELRVAEKSDMRVALCANERGAHVFNAQSWNRLN